MNLVYILLTTYYGNILYAGVLAGVSSEHCLLPHFILFAAAGTEEGIISQISPQNCYYHVYYQLYPQFIFLITAAGTEEGIISQISPQNLYYHVYYQLYPQFIFLITAAGTEEGIISQTSPQNLCHHVYYQLYAQFIFLITAAGTDEGIISQTSPQNLCHHAYYQLCTLSLYFCLQLLKQTKALFHRPLLRTSIVMFIINYYPQFVRAKQSGFKAAACEARL